MTVQLSDASAQLAGILLLSLVGVEYGGTFLLRVVQGSVPTTDFQKSFFRAGHAHAGVLVVLSLVCAILVDATSLTGVARLLAASGVPAAAILLPGGFFLAAIGRQRTTPNRFIVLVWAGAVVLAAALVTLGIGLLTR
jgi:ABC-type thiamin/hydroxymethylpyrimidine transport system permease subunit